MHDHSWDKPMPSHTREYLFTFSAGRDAGWLRAKLTSHVLSLRSSLTSAPELTGVGGTRWLSDGSWDE